MSNRGETSPEPPRPNRRQFILSGRAIQVSGWRHLRVGSLHLCHCPELKVNPIVDAQGIVWYLLGTAIDLGRAKLVSPADQYHSQDAGAGCMRAVACDWSGRWVLFSERALFADAATLLGVYYSGKGAEFIASSSSALIGSLGCAEVRDTRVPGWQGLDWYPPPLTKYRAVYKLLPDQSLDPTTGEVTYFERLQLRTEASHKSLGEIVELVRQKLISAIQALSDCESGIRITLALTSGLDSRTTLALLVDAGVDFDVCTFLHSRISDADIELPPLLAARLGVQHEFIPSSEPDAKKAAVFDKHTDNSVHGADRESFISGCFDKLPGQRWYLRSGCWELGRRYFHRKLGSTDLLAAAAYPSRVAHAFHTYVNVRASAQGFSEWANWRMAHPLHAPWQDLFYRDQRLGGWLSAIEQALDLSELTSLHLLNCDHLYEMLLAASKAGPETGALQNALIERCCPLLAEYPVNPVRGGRVEKLRGRFSQLSNVLRGECRSFARMVKAQ